MKFNKFIFDVGANEGFDGLALALKNPNHFVHAFEPNPKLLHKISFLKNEIERRIGREIINYKIHKNALGDKKETSKFYISKNDRVSSLLELSDNFDLSWPGYRESHFNVVETIAVDVITLENFMLENNIESIDYLHIDTQGNDLKVLQGAGKKINDINMGIMEAAVSKEKSAYKKNHTLSDVKIFFQNTDLEIKNLDFIELQSNDGILKNEVNITFINSKKDIRLNTSYNVRYFQRVLNNRTSIKDNLKDVFLKIINKSLLFFK
tara:strand:+ start:232 stop:1026 length:795 start_codon:yes stop_codon:yes gene_type:complete